MTERIDHAAEARQEVARLDAEVNKIGDRNDIPLSALENFNRNAARTLARAQVHATLALVEQQRMANLIALAQSTNPVLCDQVASDAANTIAEWHPHSMGGWHQVRADVAGVLGITPGQKRGSGA